MNILIKLTCLVGLTLAPLLGEHSHGKESYSAEGQKMECTHGEGKSCCKDKNMEGSATADATTYQMTAADTIAH
jgi:K(+)-stimulated pyrophosphate-energized sodium pump